MKVTIHNYSGYKPLNATVKYLHDASGIKRLLVEKGAINMQVEKAKKEALKDELKHYINGLFNDLKKELLKSDIKYDDTGGKALLPKFKKEKAIKE